MARKLNMQGWKVRALTRNPDSPPAKALGEIGIAVVHADLDDPTSLETALAGAHGAFCVTDFWEHGFDDELRMGSNLIDCAKRSAIRHFVFSSVGATERTEGMGITHFDAKREIERRLRASGLSWTILRPVTFMENIVGPRFRTAICKRGVLQFGFNRTRKFQLVAMEDLAFFVARAFEEDPRLTGQATEIASAACTMPELAEALSAKVGRPVRYVYLTTPLQRIIGAFIALTARQGRYKAGPSLINQFRWNNGSPHGGWNADLDALRQIHPGLLTLNQWIETIDWWEGLR